MRIAIVGANGRTGRQLVTQALAAGHEVTALTRHPGQVPARERLAVARADVTDPEALDAAVGVSDYQIVEGSIHGMYTARADLAACLLAQLTDDRYTRQTVGVLTTVGTPSLARQIWREAIRKRT
jgi:putative NADH-flavin reductase